MYSTIVKPLIVGTVAAAAGALFLGDGLDSIPTSLGNMPSFLPIAGSVALASAVAEVGKNYIIPKDSTSQVVASLAKPALTGAAATLAMYLLSPSGSGFNYMTPFIVGAGSEFAGDYVYEKIVSPYVAGSSAAGGKRAV